MPEHSGQPHDHPDHLDHPDQPASTDSTDSTTVARAWLTAAWAAQRAHQRNTRPAHARRVSLRRILAGLRDRAPDGQRIDRLDWEQGLPGAYRPTLGHPQGNPRPRPSVHRG